LQHKNLEYCLLKKRIKKNEGFSLKPYKDQLGFITIGFGHLVLPKEKDLIKIKTEIDEELDDIINCLKENHGDFIKPRI